jgi:hypothetical protein
MSRFPFLTPLEFPSCIERTTPAWPTDRYPQWTPRLARSPLLTRRGLRLPADLTGGVQCVCNGQAWTRRESARPQRSVSSVSERQVCDRAFFLPWSHRLLAGKDARSQTSQTAPTVQAQPDFLGSLNTHAEIRRSERRQSRKGEAGHKSNPYGIRTTEPMVFRSSRSRWARAASRSG